MLYVRAIVQLTATDYRQMARAQQPQDAIDEVTKNEIKDLPAEDILQNSGKFSNFFI